MPDKDNLPSAERLRAQTVLITGAANGIGRATAHAFAKVARHVVCTDIDGDAVASLAQEIGEAASAYRLDVKDRDAIEDVFHAASRSKGPIGVVHANAGVSSMKRAVELSEADWDFNFDVNAKGVFLTNQVAVRHFLANGQRGGVIVNTASLAAKVGAPFLAHYSASKFAVLGWTQGLAREVGKDGIRVNAVCPGFVDTPMQHREVVWEAELLGTTEDAVRRSYVEQTPLCRLQTAEDVADVVVFLASDAARFITGQGIDVNGGVFMN